MHRTRFASGDPIRRAWRRPRITIRVHLRLLVAFLAFAIGWSSFGPGSDRAWAQGGRSTVPTIYPDESFNALKLLRNAYGHELDGLWADAIGIYQRVMDDHGDSVTRLPEDEQRDPEQASLSVRFVNVQLYCQQRLSKIPLEFLRIYRDRVDGATRRAFEDALATRDAVALQRVVEEQFCSSWGDDALEALGDLAYQEGRIDEALAAYQGLVPDPNREPPLLIHPDPSVDLSQVAAKILICRQMLGDDPPSEQDLLEFNQTHPGARGRLAGRDDLLIRSLIRAIQQDDLTIPRPLDLRWPTFAGSFTRNRALDESIDIGSLQWAVPLPSIQSVTLTNNRAIGFGRGGSQSSLSRERYLAYHPIILGNQVLVNDENGVHAYNLDDRPDRDDPPPGSTGLFDPSDDVAIEVAWKHEPARKSFAREPSRNSSRLPRYTLTAHGDRVFARLGPTAYQNVGRFGGITPSSPSKIVALDRRQEGKLLWTVEAKAIRLPGRGADGADHASGFEGTPVADDQRVYVAVTELGPQTSTYVVSLDARTGDQIWCRLICFASAQFDRRMATRGYTADQLGHALLSLDGTTIYYQTNLGGLASLDTRTGSIRWIATYPRIEIGSLGLFKSTTRRDLNPAIVDGDRVLIAPEDAETVFAFDADSGRLLWETPGLQKDAIHHLLGVSQGRLIATGGHVLSIDTESGEVRGRFPDSGQPMTSYGRGVIAQDQIYWPTEDQIYALDAATLKPTGPPLNLNRIDPRYGRGGNLVAGDGYLVVAQKDRLVVYCQSARLIKRYQAEIARAPDRASNYYRLARLAESAGQRTLALENYRTAIAKASPGEWIDDGNLAETARRRLVDLLGVLARQETDPNRAATWMEQAAELALTERGQVEALLELANYLGEAGQLEQVVQTFQQILDEPRFRSQIVEATAGRSARADLVVEERLALLINEHGRQLYAEAEQRANALWDQAQAESTPRLLNEVRLRYPLAQVVVEAELSLGQLWLERGDTEDAAQVFARLLDRPLEASRRAEVLALLAKAYHLQGLTQTASQTYLSALKMLDRLGTDPQAANVDPTRIDALVARINDERDAFGLARLGDPTRLVRLNLPLFPVRSVSIEPVANDPEPLSAVGDPVRAEGVPPSREIAPLFLWNRDAKHLVALDPETGDGVWSCPLNTRPEWLGFLDDRLVAASEQMIAGIGVERGDLLWVHEPRSSDLNQRLTPFVSDSDDPSETRLSLPLKQFRALGTVVVCLAGAPEQLLGIDGTTGRVRWAFAPTTGRIHDQFYADADRVIVQLRQPFRLEILAPQTGRQLAYLPNLEQSRSWDRSPQILGGETLLTVVEQRTIEAIDLRDGSLRWVYREPDQQASRGAPMLVGDSEYILVLYNGKLLVRLDPNSGRSVWDLPLGTDDLSARPGTLRRDGSVLFAATDTTLQAIDLDSGRRLWLRPLSARSMDWSLELAENWVVAAPDPTPSLSASARRRLALVFCRRDDGRLLQRRPLDRVVTNVGLNLDDRGLILVDGRSSRVFRPWAESSPAAEPGSDQAPR